MRSSRSGSRRRVHETKPIFVIVAVSCTVRDPIRVGWVGDAGGVDEYLLDVSPPEVGVGLEDECDDSRD
jgi:hypothetical protein